jgi:hypothetical protein
MVHVSRGWLAAPIVFAGFSFFITVVVLESRHRETSPPKWKTSSIAALCDLDPHLHTTLGPMVSGSAMKYHTKEIYVRLTQDGNGWMLVDAGGASGEKDYVPLENHKRASEYPTSISS